MLRYLPLALLFVACVATGPAAPDASDPTSSTTTSTTEAVFGETTATSPATTAAGTSSASTSTTTTLPREFGPWGEVVGLTMFRGNPSRTYYGEGPVPVAPEVSWRFPDSAMCGESSVGGQPKIWCGTGWTGQPVVWERPDGVTEVMFGAYDKNLHFLDAATGRRTRPDFPMGDIIKGSITLDPDGYPLLYAGSRDPRFRILSLEGDEVRELWTLDASSVAGMWNNDWDSNPVVVDDVLYVGGENSWFFAIKLNRSYNADGTVNIDPAVVFSMPAFTDALVAQVGRQQSIESSVAVFNGVAYFTNSAGRIVGVDVSDVTAGNAEVIFDFWAGDDIDATLVIDAEGMLYASAEIDLATSRAAEVGQLIKLNPLRTDEPIMWSLAVPNRNGTGGGIWATPALYEGFLYVATNPGELLVVDSTTGEVTWRDEIGAAAWSSPVVVDNTLVLATDCEGGGALTAYDLSDPATPRRIWHVPHSSGCIESTPAIWKGSIYVGSRDGYFYAYGN